MEKLFKMLLTVFLLGLRNRHTIGVHIVFRDFQEMLSQNPGHVSFTLGTVFEQGPLSVILLEKQV